MTRSDDEQNRLSARAARYMRVGLQVGGVAARMAGARMTGTGFGEQANAVMLTQALGGLKGPLMKVAQLVATIPDLLPPDFAQELQKLQSDAPPMGAAFVKRRMIAELGPDWLTRFAQFDLKPSAAASLGQVHKATSLAGDPLACKLQYPDMQSAVEADLNQLSVLFAMHRQMDPAIDTSEIAKEIAERIRQSVATAGFHTPELNISVTVSIGVAAVSPPYLRNEETLIADADAALYRAKNSGRNRIEIAA